MQRNLAQVEKKLRSPQLARTQTHRLTARNYRKSSAQASRGKNVGIINKTIRKLNDLAHIVYHPLDLPSTYIVGYADAAFPNNADNSSQMGYIVLLKDKKRPRSHRPLRLLEMPACYPIRAWL